MNRLTPRKRDTLESLMEGLAARFGVEPDHTAPFADHSDLLAELLGHVAGNRRRLVVAGHASPQVAIAADRAGLKTVEVLGASPFVNHPEDLLEALGGPDELIYLANPNWVTGAGYSLRNLHRIAEAVPRGRLILDEKYHQLFGITGLPLLKSYDQVLLIRSLASSTGLTSSEGGCLIANRCFMAGFRQAFDWMHLSQAERRRLRLDLKKYRQAEARLTQIHDEALRLVTELTERGVQNRLTSADFLLLRVADPRRVCEYMSRLEIEVESLERYDGMKHYVRYQVGRPSANDDFLIAFSRMPAEFYWMFDYDHRAVMFHRPAQTPTITPVDTAVEKETVIIGGDYA